MVQTYPGGRYARPAKALLLEGFRIEADTAAIPPDDANTVRPFRPEHIKRSVERVETAISDQSHQGCRTFSEVDRLARHVNDNAGRDHALRTARSIFTR